MRNNGSGIRMMTTYSGYKLEDGTAYTYAESSNPSSVIFWVRYKTAGESFTYTFQGLEAGHIYKFSGLLGWHNNSNAPTMTVELKGTNSIAKTSKTISAKQTLYEVFFSLGRRCHSSRCRRAADGGDPFLCPFSG